MNNHQKIDISRKQAMEWMKSDLGQQAIEGKYYTEMFAYVFHQCVQDKYPSSIPNTELEKWKSIGWYRTERSAKTGVRESMEIH